MKASLACAVAFLLLVVGPTAQERSHTDEKRDEQLAAYLRKGRYADARRLIDQMLRAGAGWATNAARTEERVVK